MRRFIRHAGLVLTLALAAPAVRGQEYIYTHAPGLSDIRPNSTFELWVSDQQPAGQPVRGLVAIFNYEGQAAMYTDPRFRAWAARENLGLLRHRMRNYDNQFTIAKTPSAANLLIGTALPALAAQSGRPEIADAGLIWTGLSQGGWASVALGNFSESRTIAVLPVHDSTGARDPSLATSTLGLTIPTLHLLGERDNVNGGTLAAGDLYAQTIVGHATQRRALGSLSAIAVQRDAGHTQWGGPPQNGDTDVNFMQSWMETVVDLRVPEVITPGTPYALATLTDPSGRLGTLDLQYGDGNPFVQVTGGAIGPYDTVNPLQQWWLPNADIGQYWRDYNVTGVPEPSSVVLTPLALAAGYRLRRRRK